MPRPRTVDTAQKRFRSSGVKESVIRSGWRLVRGRGLGLQWGVDDSSGDASTEGQGHRFMGTSTAQRSPATPAWDEVRELYRAGVKDPARISRHVVAALTPETRAQMQGPGVVACLDTALRGAVLSAQVPPEGLLADVSGGLPAAARLRQEAERRLAVEGLGSRFADLALDALGSCLVAAMGMGGGLDRLGAYEREGRLHELAARFLGEDLDRVFRYFVTRDIADFVGTSAWPTVGEARRVAIEVGGYCRAHALREQPSEDALREALGHDAQGRLAALRVPFGGALEAGLRRIHGG